MPRWLVAALLFATGCSTTTEPDDVVDAGSPVDAGPIDAAFPDASAPTDAASPDATVEDGGPDSLVGTTLEGITVEWTDPLELCSAWVEGLERDEALGQRAQLSLVPQPRGLSRAELASGTLSGRVRHGPFAAEHWTIPGTTTASVVRYEIFDRNGDASLSAMITRDLGPAGVLYEQLSVQRRVGDRSPVIYGDGYEAVFTLRRPGAANDTFFEICGGPARLGRAVEVLTATSATDSLTLLRELRTEDALDGSYPVNLIATELHPSDHYPIHLAAGFWSQTYVAQHHNWNETSIIDYTEDFEFYEYTYESYLSGTWSFEFPVITRVESVNVNPTSGRGALDVTTLDVLTMQTTVERWSASRWMRVDDAGVRASIQNACAGGELRTIHDFQSAYAFQFLTCPRADAPGWELRTLIPVLFPHDVSQVGQRVSGAAITPLSFNGRSGFSVALGTSHIEISRVGLQGGYLLEIFDEAFSVGYATLDFGELFLRPVQGEYAASSADDAVKVAFTRQFYPPTHSGAVNYLAPSASFTFEGMTHFVEAWDRINYTSTHHNWSDHLEAEADGYRMYWRTEYGANGPEDHVRVERISDRFEVVPEVEVFPGR